MKKLTQKTKAYLLAHYGHKCMYCHRQTKEGNLIVFPILEELPLEISNSILVCQECRKIQFTEIDTNKEVHQKIMEHCIDWKLTHTK